MISVLALIGLLVTAWMVTLLDVYTLLPIMLGAVYGGMAVGIGTVVWQVARGHG